MIAKPKAPKAPKAPKDMTATEFVDVFAERYKDYDTQMLPIACAILMRGMLKDPAPELFTQDQLATMREYQRDGVNYAANNSGRVLLFYKNKPVSEHSCWNAPGGVSFTLPPEQSFLGRVLAENEVICFADYAPL